VCPRVSVSMAYEAYIYSGYLEIIKIIVILKFSYKVKTSLVAQLCLRDYYLWKNITSN